MSLLSFNLGQGLEGWVKISQVLTLSSQGPRISLGVRGSRR